MPKSPTKKQNRSWDCAFNNRCSLIWRTKNTQKYCFKFAASVAVNGKAEDAATVLAEPIFHLEGVVAAVPSAFPDLLLPEAQMANPEYWVGHSCFAGLGALGRFERPKAK